MAPKTQVPVAEPEIGPKPRVQSAARAIGILLAVAKSENGLTTREISEQVGIGRQATYHLLHTLTATGMVSRDDRNRYLLGVRVGTLVEGFGRQLSPSEHLGPMVRALSQDTGETAYAAGWRSGEIATLAISPGSKPVLAAEAPQGYIGDAHARASGKLLLAQASDPVRDAYLDTHPLTRLTPNTITNRRALEKELARVREDGYALDLEEFAPGLCCMAVPLDEGHSPFVLSIGAPRERFEHERDRYLEIMKRAAALPGAEAD
jgi:IclR family acetate operon transcriptional repressor